MTTPMLARSESCVTVAMSVPSMRDRAALAVVEAQQQVDDRRLAGAGAADEADLLARADVQVELVDHAALLAVVEADVVEADVALDDDRAAWRPAVGDDARQRDRARCRPDGADVLEQRRHFPHHPLAHALEAHDEAERHRDARRAVMLPLQPEPDADAADREQQQRVEQRDDRRCSSVNSRICRWTVSRNSSIASLA